MTGEKHEEISALSPSPGPESASAPKAPGPVEGPRDIFVPLCRILGCLFTFFITWGVASSFSAYQAYYQQSLLPTYSPSTISWIGTVQTCLLGLTGIVSGALYDRGYIRQLLITGCFLVVLGFFMLSLAKEFYQIILTQGVCIGFGQSS